MFNKFKITIAIALIIFGILGRLFLVKYVGIPNFEIITALALVSAFYLGRTWGLVVPLSVMAITDVAIGNNPILLFTWSAFAMIAIFGMIFKKLDIKSSKYQVLGLTGVGVISSVFFFLYTNFGWWLMTNMYAHNLDGLIQAYIMGLPFFKNNLVGNLIFVPMFSGAAVYIKWLKTQKNTKVTHKILAN